MAVSTQTLLFQGLDGYAGFWHGQCYQLRYARLEDGSVNIEPDYPGRQPVGPIVGMQRGLIGSG